MESRLQQKRLTTARCFTFSVLLLVSTTSLVLASSHVLILTSDSTTFNQMSVSSIIAHKALVLYCVTLPISSVIHLSLDHLIWVSQPDTLSPLYNHLSMLIISAGLSFGWIINTGFWTGCEAREGRYGPCPLELQNALGPLNTSFSTGKMIIGWTITTIYILYSGILCRMAIEEHSNAGTVLGPYMPFR